MLVTPDVLPLASCDSAADVDLGFRQSSPGTAASQSPVPAAPHLLNPSDVHSGAATTGQLPSSVIICDIPGCFDVDADARFSETVSEPEHSDPTVSDPDGRLDDVSEPETEAVSTVTVDETQTTVVVSDSREDPKPENPHSQPALAQPNQSPTGRSRRTRKRPSHFVVEVTAPKTRLKRNSLPAPPEVFHELPLPENLRPILKPARVSENCDNADSECVPQAAAQAQCMKKPVQFSDELMTVEIEPLPDKVPGKIRMPEDSPTKDATGDDDDPDYVGFFWFLFCSEIAISSFCLCFRKIVSVIH